MCLHCQAKEKANRVEEQLQELTAKLAAMETEKHSLATRNKVLETALATAKASPVAGVLLPAGLLAPSTMRLHMQASVMLVHLRFMAHGACERH